MDPGRSDHLHAVRRRHLFVGLLSKLHQLPRGHVQRVPRRGVLQMRRRHLFRQHRLLELQLVPRRQAVARRGFCVRAVPRGLCELRERCELHIVRRGPLRGRERLVVVHGVLGWVVRTKRRGEQLHAVRARPRARRHGPGGVPGMRGGQVRAQIRDHFVRRLPGCHV